MVISKLTVCNRSATPTTFRVSISPNGAALADTQYVCYDVAIAANEALELLAGLTIDATDKVRVYATLATLTFGLFGTEIT